ncbi:hypothetical protein [Streptomyces olivoreticuli]|uniref:hypothetical protein n=1 Tax=Streptomyces olivoreticuli TaxID=68246 RepID=UPI0013C2FDAB|nr:hypothetical protein [Streptomyces olivoreticuli]
MGKNDRPDDRSEQQKRQEEASRKVGQNLQEEDVDVSQKPKFKLSQSGKSLTDSESDDN